MTHKKQESNGVSTTAPRYSAMQATTSRTHPNALSQTQIATPYFLTHIKDRNVSRVERFMRIFRRYLLQGELSRSFELQTSKKLGE